ncbi:DUF5994 family protein [Nocardia sp. NPDC050193]
MSPASPSSCRSKAKPAAGTAAISPTVLYKDSRPTRCAGVKAAASSDSETSGYIDAVWWPRSSNLATELRDLIPALRGLTGPIERIVYDPRAWSPTDRHRITDGTIRLDPYPVAGKPRLRYLGVSNDQTADSMRRG